MELYSAKELCDKYPTKYIAVKIIEQDFIDTEILQCQVLKVYDSLDACKKSATELRFFQKLYSDKFDVIYGDYKDYQSTRCTRSVFHLLGGIAFELFGMNSVDSDEK